MTSLKQDWISMGLQITLCVKVMSFLPVQEAHSSTLVVCEQRDEAKWLCIRESSEEFDVQVVAKISLHSVIDERNKGNFKIYLQPW